MKAGLVFVFILVFSLSVFIAFADYVQVGASQYANHSTNVTVRGFVLLDNSSGISNTNVSGSLVNSNFSIVTNSQGFFTFNLTAPNSTGHFNVTLSTNNSLSKTIDIYVSNLTNVVFNFTDKRPPFANGSSFLVNISFSGRTNIAPRVEIFSANSVNSSGWMINNLSSRINIGSILYNITVPSNADGRYVIVFEEGAGSSIFLVKSSLVAVADIQDSENSTTTTYGSGENFTVIGKVRDENNAITNANVTAFITFPNGTIVNLTLIHNFTGTDGAYGAIFNRTGLPGDYKIEIVANASGKIVRSNSLATVQSLQGQLAVVKDFFFDFGSQSAFQRGGNVEFHVLVFNLSNDILLNGSTTTNAGAEVNCTAVRVVELRNVLNGSALSNPTLTKSLGLFLGQNVCKIRFTAPNSDGIFALTVNASVGASQTNNLSVLATGYFSVQSFILKPSPVSSFGSGQEFLTFLMPGDNATFELSVRNLSASGAAVAGNLITNFNVTRITPMDFIGGGQSEITNIQVLEYTNGTASANPRIKLRVPDNRTGPFQIEFQATVAGSVVRGNAFYFARFIEGFIFPASFGGGFGHGGGEGGPESSGPIAGGSFRCSGAQNFTAQTFDVRTRQAARSVTFNSIQEAREELTGRSVLSSLTLVNSSSTDSSGIGNLTISFSGSFSGFYFVLINITTSDGKSDSLPGGFECRQLSFFPQITAIGSTGSGGFFVAPTAGLNITVSGIRNLNTGNPTTTGSVSIVKLESFDPTKGHKAIPGPATTFPLVGGAATFTIFPANFSGLGDKWFNGFNDVRVRVCDNSTSPATCDTTFGGFMVVAFDAFLDFSAQPPSQVSANTSVVYRIMARTNVTNFTVQVGLPWEGSVQDAVVNSSTKVSDSWDSPLNSTDFNGFERWDVNITMPATLRKGFNMIIIKVNNYLGEQTEVFTFVSASKLSITVPDTEGIITTNNSAGASLSSAAHVAGFRTEFRTDLSVINSTFLNTSSKVGNACAIKDFNTTRFGVFSQGVTYRINATVFTLDNATSGTYDVLVINNSGSIAVATAANRSLASAGFPGLYLVNIESCGFVKIINTTTTESSFGAGFAGQHQVNTTVTIPFIVKQGAIGKSGVVVDVSQILQQQDFGGGRGGFGFVDFLPRKEFRVVGLGTTDSRGVAFLQLSVNSTGSYSILWNLSDAGDTDTADFSQGVLIEIKSILTEGGTLAMSNPNLVTLTRNATETRNATIGGSPIYYATWSEASRGELVPDFQLRTHHLALRNTTQAQPVGVSGSLSTIGGGLFTEVILDDDVNLCTNCTTPEGDSFVPLRGNWTDTLEASFGAKVTVDGANETTINGTAPSVQLVFGSPNTGFVYLQNPSNAKNVTANVTVRACAFTFGQPKTPLINANVSRLTTRVFSFSGPPTTQNLTIFNPFTNGEVTSVLTGPSGCATFNVTKSGGWPTGFSNEIKGRIVSGGSDEEVFIGSVYVACPSTGSCF